MARLPRLEIPGTPLHVIQRGNNRAACFFGDLDRRFYLKCLAEAALRRRCAVHAYVLMTNHVHLLVTPAESGAAAAMMQDVGRRYVRIINTIHGRYIEMNPVRAGLANRPIAYRWSSHHHYAAGIPDRLITEHALFTGLGATDTERRAAFRSLFEGSDAFLTRAETALGRRVRPPKRGRPVRPAGMTTIPGLPSPEICSKSGNLF